jgi:hypothetical protein
VSDEQVELVAKVPRRLPNISQWFAIFNIVLPQRPLPPSHLLGDGVESAVARLRAFWDREGEWTVSEFVTKTVPGMNDYRSIADEERSLAALHRDVLTSMVGMVLDSFPQKGEAPMYFVAWKVTGQVESLQGLLSKVSDTLRRVESI